MLGAIVDDIAGSLYEHNNIKYCIESDEMLSEHCRFTDDTVMTCAVADGIVKGLMQLPNYWLNTVNYEEILCNEIVSSMQLFGKKYLNAGYGFNFLKWILSSNPKPYNSFGNGSAMRVSYVGWIARSLEEAEILAELSAKVTHNHPDGIKGAIVVAGSIYKLLHNGNKEDIRKYAESFYNIDFSLDQIRTDYSFDVSCQGSVPQAIVAFLEGTSFSDVISKAISIGGDSDTIAAIAGSLAETMYQIPTDLYQKAIYKLDDFLVCSIEASIKFRSEYLQR